MRIVVTLVSLIALAAIVASATTVIIKADRPALAVEVTGVPGYVYYERAYDLTIEYANHGGAIDGPVELTTELPETFALAEHIADPTRHGESLVWHLDGLDASETGSIPVTVRGTLPDDLTNAVYDLPGYEGHTAFVEGFDLAVTLTAGDTTATTLAVADTGEFVTTFNVDKVCIPSDDLTTFSVFVEGVDSNFREDKDIQCGGSVAFDLPEGEYIVGENLPENFEDYLPPELVGDCEPTIDTASTELLCTVTNTQTGTITIIKDVNPEPDGRNFSFTDDIPGCSIGTLDDDGGGATPNSVTCEDVPVGSYEVSEDASTYTLTSINCVEVDGIENSTDSGRTASIELEVGETVTCTFTNVQPSTATPTRTPTVTATSTVTATLTPTKTVTATATKTPITTAATATKTPVATSSPVVIVVPPSTGDGGLLDSGGLPWFFAGLGVVALSATAWLYLQKAAKPSRRG